MVLELNLYVNLLGISAIQKGKVINSDLHVKRQHFSFSLTVVHLSLMMKLDFFFKAAMVLLVPPCSLVRCIILTELSFVLFASYIALTMFIPLRNGRIE